MAPTRKYDDSDSPLFSLPPISSLIRTEACSHPEVSGSINQTETKQLYRTKWLCLQSLTYRSIHRPSTSNWDMVTRSTRSENSVTDAVAVIARIRFADDVPRILLVKQFRPPINGVTVELPAGLVDHGESVEQAALRELREETGFIGTVVNVHEPAPLSPGLTDESVVLVEVNVQVGEGGKQKQELEPSENVHVVSVPVNRLLEALRYMERVEHLHVMHAVTTMAVGISMASSLTNTL